jgi:hypothetical protein
MTADEARNLFGHYLALKTPIEQLGALKVMKVTTYSTFNELNSGGRTRRLVDESPKESEHAPSQEAVQEGPALRAIVGKPRPA